MHKLIVVPKTPILKCFFCLSFLFLMCLKWLRRFHIFCSAPSLMEHVISSTASLWKVIHRYKNDIEMGLEDGIKISLQKWTILLITNLNNKCIHVSSLKFGIFLYKIHLHISCTSLHSFTTLNNTQVFWEMF